MLGLSRIKRRLTSWPRIRQEANDGDVSAKSQREARAFGQSLRTKLAAQPLADPADQKDATRFLTACTSVMALLEKPNIRPALVELRKIQDTMIGNLLGFMHVYNLRFGPAKTVQEKRAYQQLFTILDETRDQVLAEAKIDRSARASRANSSKAATDFYQNLEQGANRSRHLRRRQTRNSCGGHVAHGDKHEAAHDRIPDAPVRHLGLPPLGGTAATGRRGTAGCTSSPTWASGRRTSPSRSCWAISSSSPQGYPVSGDLLAVRARSSWPAAPRT